MGYHALVGVVNQTGRGLWHMHAPFPNSRSDPTPLIWIRILLALDQDLEAGKCEHLSEVESEFVFIGYGRGHRRAIINFWHNVEMRSAKWNTKIKHSLS